MEFTSHPGVSRVGRHATSHSHPGEEQLWNIRCLRVREIAELAFWDGTRKGSPIHQGSELRGWERSAAEQRRLEAGMSRNMTTRLRSARTGLAENAIAALEAEEAEPPSPPSPGLTQRSSAA
jgi:hypothetical protein